MEGFVDDIPLPGEHASTRVERKADTLAEASRAVALEQTTFSDQKLDRFLLFRKKVRKYLLQGFLYKKNSSQKLTAKAPSKMMGLEYNPQDMHLHIR